MNKPNIPFFIFLVLLLLTIPHSFDFSTSVIPGWHTSIFPPYFIWGVIVAFCMLLATIGYWLLHKRNYKTNMALFAIHLLLTIPTIIHMNFPTILLNYQLTDQNEMINAMEFWSNLILTVWAGFIAGQILFLIYFIKVIKTNITVR